MREQDRQAHAKTKRRLKIIGILLILCGVGFCTVGFVDFFSAFSGNGMPTKFWCLFCGLPLLGIGISVTILAFRQEITRYVKNESVPVWNEMGEELRPGVQNLASAVKQGLQSKALTCVCGTTNPPGSQYCTGCGKPLVCTCPACKATLPQNSKFCGSCGRKL